MPNEIEAKIKVSEREARLVMGRVNDWQSGYGKAELQVNRYFDTKGDKLSKKGQSLRIRSTTEINSLPYPSQPKIEITHKGPIKKGKFKTCDETELHLPQCEVDHLIAILAALGFKETFCYQKKRYTYYHVSLDTAEMCDVCIDEIPHLGWYVEVEGPNEKAIEHVLEEIGLLGRKNIKDGYPKLIKAFLATSKQPQTKVEFI